MTKKDIWDLATGFMVIVSFASMGTALLMVLMGAPGK